MAGDPVAKGDAAVIVIKGISADLSVIDLMLQAWTNDEGEGDAAYDKLCEIAEKVSDIRTGLEISMRARALDESEFEERFMQEIDEDD